MNPEINMMITELRATLYRLQKQLDCSYMDALYAIDFVRLELQHSSDTAWLEEGEDECECRT